MFQDQSIYRSQVILNSKVDLFQKFESEYLCQLFQLFSFLYGRISEERQKQPDQSEMSKTIN